MKNNSELTSRLNQLYDITERLKKTKDQKEKENLIQFGKMLCAEVEKVKAGAKVKNTISARISYDIAKNKEGIKENNERNKVSGLAHKIRQSKNDY